MKHKVLLLLEKANSYQVGYDAARVLRVYEEQEFDRAEEDLQMIQLTNPQSFVLLVDPHFTSNPSLRLPIESIYQEPKVKLLGGQVGCASESSQIL